LFLKRVVDILLSSLGLVFLLPVVAVVLLLHVRAGRRSLWVRERICTAGGRVATVMLLRPDVVAWLPLRGAPALLAVLKGDIGLVGPRPRRWKPGQIATASPSLTAIAPGLTGPWRLAGPRTTLEEQALADLTYVRNYSIWEDLRILWHTGGRLLSWRLRGERLGRWYLTTEVHADRTVGARALPSDVS
jgi:lipopolysaccharide/colanic/teichoic acid biosynthesis glycosyltransferase